MIAPSPDLLNDLIGPALGIEAGEARLFGLDASTKQQISLGPATFAQPVSDEEAERQCNRPTEDERDQFTILFQKMQGRWVQPRYVETTAEPLSR